MTDTTAVAGPKADDTPVVSIVDDVNEAADEASGLGCGDDNPYK
jgi:hypothetical protein